MNAAEWSGVRPRADYSGVCACEVVNDWPHSAGLLSGCVQAVVDLWSWTIWQTAAETTGQTSDQNNGEM